jgi:phosphate transport system permease protein
MNKDKNNPHSEVTPHKLSKMKPGSKKEIALETFFAFCSALSIVMTIGIVIVLLYDAMSFFRQVSIINFLTETKWNPNIKPVKFGVLPLVSGTLVFTAVTAILALPVGLLAAIFLSEYSLPGVRNVIKPALELLAGLPTVVYGYFALVYITPLLRVIFPGIQTFNVLSAAIVVAIMIIPTIASISEDAMKSVPHSLREAAYALGGTKFQVSTGVVVPSALSGIVSSFILGISRAIGETMAVTIAAGNLSRIVNPFNLEDALLKPIQTMTAAMVEIGMSDVTGDSVAYKSLSAVGLTLFLLTLTLNGISQLIKKKYREEYQ